MNLEGLSSTQPGQNHTAASLWCYLEVDRAVRGIGLEILNVERDLSLRRGNGHRLAEAAELSRPAGYCDRRRIDRVSRRSGVSNVGDRNCLHLVHDTTSRVQEGPDVFHVAGGFVRV